MSDRYIEDKYEEALNNFQQSFMEGAECWNAYVSATIGFLEEDKNKIQNVIKIIESSSEKDKRSGNLEIVNNFLKALEQEVTDYNTVYNMPHKKLSAQRPSSH